MTAVDEYLKRAEAAWDDPHHFPDDETLRQIALDVGMTDDESLDAHHRAEELAEAAAQALQAGRLQEALQAARHAALLSPVTAEHLVLVARVYTALFDDSSDPAHLELSLSLAARAAEDHPKSAAARDALVEARARSPRYSISWRQAALIVFILVAVSGTMTFCVRITMGPEVTQEQTEDIRRQLEEAGPPPTRH